MYNNINDVEFDLTHKCNLDCCYCYLQIDKKKIRNKPLSIAEVDLFLSNYFTKELKEDKIKFSFWGGEPLIEFDLIKYIVDKSSRLCDFFEKSISFRVVTNGVLITSEIAKYFSGKKNVHIQITLDGDEVTHEQQRKSKNKERTYNILKDNIELLNKHKVSYMIRTTLTAKSKNPFEIIEGFLKDKILVDKVNCGGVAFGILTPISKKNFNDLYPINFDTLIDNLFVIHKSSFSGYLYNVKRELQYLLSTNKRIGCDAGFKKIAISANGLIYPCHRFTTNIGFSIGDLDFGLYDDKLSEFEKFKLKSTECCNLCDKKVLCGGLCYHEALIYKNNAIRGSLCEFHGKMVMSTIRYIISEANNDKKGGLMSNFDIFMGHSREAFERLVLKKISSVVEIDLGEEGILTCGANNKKYIANVTVMAIWSLIDGHCTAKEIANRLASNFDVNVEAIERDIYEQLTLFKELGFVEEVNIV